jgi:putative transposase
MPRYHRFYLPNHPVFITCVTHKRERLFLSKENIDLLWWAVQKIQERTSFVLSAFAILPDHFHWLMDLPEEQSNFSTVLQKFKWKFTVEYSRRSGTGFVPDINHLSCPLFNHTVIPYR